ncbi:pseudaminic acid synthase [Bradyrhizobium sp. G127]|nr:pseudaminic acid synthase [Bradyrhizobium sp. G127]MCF2524455.1 pseudaminic acid synthase [Bradyrhizobium sp. G127]
MENPVIEIAGRKIGPDFPPYVIAEISANHKLDIERCLMLIDAAADTGADAVKIQSYTPDTITIDSDRPEFLIRGGLWDGYRLYDLYKEAYTPFEWHPELFERARKRNLTLFSTPFDQTAVDLLASLDAPAYKIASFEANDLPLIRYVAQRGKPMIISTGMANLGEIGEAVSAAREAGATQIALLHCVSAYPAGIEDANVATVPHLASAFDCVAGLSDHTPGIGASVASVVLGGCIIEKHFTVSRADGGHDAEFSLDQDEFRNLVNECKAAWAAVGKVNYDLLGSEKGSIMHRRSLYAVKPVAKGEMFSAENVRSIRPGNGLAPKYLPKILGRQASRDIAFGEPLGWDMVQASG